MFDLLEKPPGLLELLVVIVDLGLVTLIIYRVILLLNRTRAVQLLIGAALILLTDVVARWLELQTLSWVITNVSSYLVFALIVLLQPELRRLVSDIGQMGIFQWLNPIETTRLDSIVEAMQNMARTRTGSIICILRDIKSQGIIENAVGIDAEISAELLQTIFHKDTALHDGAVFIEGDRILAASCYLPLSNNTSILKKTHGARHRAALGMSEETDAIIVVSSEETGRISVLYKGEMRAAIKNADLKMLINQLLNGELRSLRSYPTIDKMEKPIEKGIQETTTKKASGRGRKK